MGKEDIRDIASKEEKAQHRVRILSVVIVAVTAMVFILMYLATVRSLQYVYTNQTYQDAAQAERTVLSDTMQDLITQIEQVRALRVQDETILVGGLAPSVEIVLGQMTGTDVSPVKNYFSNDPALSGLTFVLYDTSTRKVLADDKGLTGESGVWTEDVRGGFAVCAERSAGGKTIVYGITASAFDQEMLGIFRERLKNHADKEGIRYWVDRVTTTDNGKVSFVRLLDPENPSREGMSSEKGGAGKGPEQFATEGLMDAEPGEQIFHTGDAEWTDAQGRTIVTQTVSCAQYYAPYSWVLCGAFRLDRVGERATLLQEESRKQTIRLGIQVAVSFAVVLAIAIFLILRNSVAYYNIRQSRLRDQVEKDALTRANTRGYGTQLLAQAYRLFLTGKEPSPVIMVLDVDKFKNINDTYGHDSGDEALKHVVRAASRVGRGKDCVIRWGGDEFIAVFYRMERNRSEATANKLRKAIGDNPVNVGSLSFHVTVSVGVTWFQYGDMDFNDALRRADEALYESKEKGRNRVCMAVPDVNPGRIKHINAAETVPDAEPVPDAELDEEEIRLARAQELLAEMSTNREEIVEQDDAENLRSEEGVQEEMRPAYAEGFDADGEMIQYTTDADMTDEGGNDGEY